jgi:ABC-type uncharacterized transport system involved in gliding motility auxiliary subunit
MQKIPYRIKVVLLLLLFVAGGLLLNQRFAGARLDLTESKQFTLSEGTLSIARNLQEPVELTLYYSESRVRDRQAFRLYAQRVRELIEEVALRSNEKITLKVIDPKPFSEQEDQAVALGLQAVPLGEEDEALYFGLSAKSKNRDPASMPFIHPDKEIFLEYDLATLLQRASSDKKPVLAILGSLNTGPGLAGDGSMTPGFAIDRELAQRYELRRMQANPTFISDDVDVLILLHPQQLSADTYYAIDQFVLAGGRLLLFVDPYAEADIAFNPLDSMQSASPKASDLSVLFNAWGVNFSADTLHLDRTFAMQVEGSDGKTQRSLAVLGLNTEAMNQDDVVTAQLDNINLSTVGSFERRDDSSLRFEPLLQGSGDSMSISVADFQLATMPADLERQFTAKGDSPAYAVRLSGVLKTAFPNRKQPNQILNSKKPVNMILVADTDLWSDRLWTQSSDFLGQPLLNPFARNADFINNCIENLLGGADLIAVRTRANTSRPFHRVDAIRKRAEQRYLLEEKRLQESLSKLEREMTVMNMPADTNALTPKQQAEVKRYLDEKLKIRKQLRTVRLEMNQEIESLGTRIKLMNILGVPLLIVFIVLGLWAWRRWHRS